MAVILRNLTDFKRFLGKPGATIQLVRNTFMDRQPESTREAYRAKGMYAPRAVQALSRKAAVFTCGGSPGPCGCTGTRGRGAGASRGTP